MAQAGQEIDSTIYLDSLYYRDSMNKPLNLVELWSAIKIEAEEFKPRPASDAAEAST
jgi:hypothetical protein